MLYKDSQSLLDILLKLMPDLQPGQNIVFLRAPTVNNKAAKTLMSLWKNEDNVISHSKLKRPDNLSTEDLNLLEKENLVYNKGDYLEITSKGQKALKTMILGDDRSVYEDDGKTLDYHVAEANLKPKRMLKKAKMASINNLSGNWYKRLS